MYFLPSNYKESCTIWIMYCPIYFLHILKLCIKLRWMQTDNGLLVNCVRKPTLSFFCALISTMFKWDQVQSTPSLWVHLQFVLAGQTGVKMYTKTTTSRLRTVATIPTMPSMCSRSILHRPVSPTLSPICKRQREHSSSCRTHMIFFLRNFKSFLLSWHVSATRGRHRQRRSQHTAMRLHWTYSVTLGPLKLARVMSKIIMCDAEYYCTD